jgi:alpha-N-arabinofuranosidase
MILKHTALVFFIFVTLISKIIGQSTFQNPVIRGMNADPSICRVGDDFYLVTSSFEYFPGLPIYHSKDMVHWELIGYALSRISNCPLGGVFPSGGNYAPTTAPIILHVPIMVDMVHKEHFM